MSERMQVLRDYMDEAKNSYDGDELISIFQNSAERASRLNPRFNAGEAYFKAMVLKRKEKVLGQLLFETNTLFQEAIELANQEEDPASHSVLALAITMRACMHPDFTLTLKDVFRLDDQKLKILEERAGQSLQTEADIIKATSIFATALTALSQENYSTNRAVAKAIQDKSLRFNDGVLPEAITFTLTAVADSLSLAENFKAAGDVFEYIINSLDPNYLAVRFQYARALRREIAKKASESVVRKLKDVSSDLLSKTLQMGTSSDQASLSDFEAAASRPADFCELLRNEKVKYLPRVPLETAATLYALAKSFEQSYTKQCDPSELNLLLQKSDYIDAVRFRGDRGEALFPQLVLGS